MNKTYLKPKCIAIILAGILTISPTLVCADWTIKELGTLDGTTSKAHGINNSGRVVGVADERPFITGANGVDITSLGGLPGKARASMIRVK